jgi:DNA-binding transcriptional regulator YdaS (Cro superfamily)
MKAIQRAIQAAGSQVRLAQALGVTQQSVQKWTRKNVRVPAERVIAIERVTGVSRHELRPDIYPTEHA